ncbi:cytochrome-c oxidase, cbb3-type subunit III [Stappia sp. F7233]|uniref:Cbb3-type cytochrome c oxidase subunit n=1 Tax=Stappia albiluteola TaxID=2758565 RepID=A0A839ABT5_9HYPH|nr:cytochrome-c oxidase, cbb3-type subunit III [Stappia albiluteola]MBA5776149.1 cytochrome-c oxidase, cbb3-type subunit III [Stappia albiluteola]
MADGHNKEIDALSGVETTGHEWDGLKELNNPLPRWWLYLFYATCVWAFAYWIIYPAWPLVSGYTRGVLGISQRADAIAAYEAGMAERAETGQALINASLDEIQSNPQLLEFAMASGQAAFGDNCAPCHGSGATGAVGYPNLQDDKWIWGGSIDDLHQTIRFGIRSGHDEARIGDMPAFGRDGILDKQQVDQVASYVATLAGIEPEAGVDVAAGETVFAENCAACHGDDGKGLQELGAPDLTAPNYLYGKSLEAIKAQVTNARNGVMPNWEGRLDPATVKSLAVYVHSLGGGQ